LRAPRAAAQNGGDLMDTIEKIEAAAQAGAPLIGKILDLIVRAASAKDEEHTAIVEAFEAAEAEIDARAPAARQTIEEETSKTEAAIAEHAPPANPTHIVEPKP
jgi:hypothetical protein